MTDFFTESVFFGLLLSLGAYELGLFLKNKTGLAVMNPLLISSAIIIAVLVLTGVDYESYNEGARFLSYMLTPTTVCLAIPLYEKLALLKRDFKAIILGIISGVITSGLCVFAMAVIFGFNHELYVTLLPKSITTAIGVGISEELGGIIAVTASVIAITGIFGNVTADFVLKLFRITEPVAKGIAIGSASHAMGTAKAMEIGETEGAMSSLSIAVSGVCTVIAASIFAQFM